jgi:predicted nucleotidyltransferase
MKHLNIQKLKSQLKKICKNKEIIDIILFGSVVKDKDNPNDIDIAIILEKEDYSFVQEVSKEIKNLLDKKFHIEILTIDNLFKEPLYLTLIHEGFSIKNNQFINKSLKTKSLVLVTYDLTILNHSKKTLFGYALKGRKGEKGFLDEINGKITGRNNVLVPTHKFEQLKDFLKTWKVEYTSQRFLKVNTIL